MTTIDELTDDQLIAAYRTAGGQPPAQVAAAELGDDDLLLVGGEPARVLKVNDRADGLLGVTLAAGTTAMVTDQPNRSLTCPPTYGVTRLSTKAERDAWLSQPPDADEVTDAAARYDDLLASTDAASYDDPIANAADEALDADLRREGGDR